MKKGELPWMNRRSGLDPKDEHVLATIGFDVVLDEMERSRRDRFISSGMGIFMLALGVGFVLMIILHLWLGVPLPDMSDVRPF